MIQTGLTQANLVMVGVNNLNHFISCRPYGLAFILDKPDRSFQLKDWVDSRANAFEDYLILCSLTAYYLY